jgi:hypothetical protein
MKAPNWERIRAHYRHNDTAIHQAGRSVFGIDPYAWEHEAGIFLSPIERSLWHDIRIVAVVLYPQYPVGRRFVDFGNPGAKVAIECDGAAWHKDSEADAQRQREIEAQGWTVYRISGRDCFTAEKETEDEEGRIRFKSGAAEDFIREVSERHGMRQWAPRTGRAAA